MGLGNPPAFILGLGENGYGVLRSLAREGVRVCGFFTKPGEFGRYSRYCEAQELPPILKDDEICRVLIESSGRYGSKPVLFPTSDHHTSILANYRGELSRHFQFHWLGAESLGRIVDKARMSGICREAGVLTPRTHVTRADENLAEFTREWSFPCLIKPNQSFDSPFPPKLKNFVARSREEFLAFYQTHPALKGATICQEIIEGGDENVYQCTALIRGSGEPGAVFCARKLRQYRPGYGVMCFGRSEENELLASQALQLLRSLRYRGLASLEFKYRVADGRFYFIEMNPRLPWYNALCLDAGVNLPYLAYLDLTESWRAQPVCARQRDGVHWLSFKLDLGWYLQTRGQRRGGLLSWLRSMARARSYAWFNWRDPGPFLRATADLAGMAARQFFRGFSEGGF